MRIFTSRGSARRRDIDLPLMPSRRSSRRVVGCGVAAVVLLAGCGPKAEAGGNDPELVTRAGARYEYYDVEGATPFELSQSIRRERPASQTMVDAPAGTSPGG